MMINFDYKLIDIRKTIWIALSEFYLDTELASEDFDRIADVFNKSGLGINEIKDIDLYEVFPLLQVNLLSMAGAWNGFDEDWLLPECEKRFQRRENIIHRLNCRFWNNFFYWMRRDYWNAIEKRMGFKRWN
jgi:hypothetical protein